jgi:hypothetical protein
MAQYDFTNENGILKISLQLQSGLYKSQIMSLSTPSASLSSDRIKVYDSGHYMDTFNFSDLGLIGVASYATIELAFDALTDLIADVLRSQSTAVVP